ncbi:SLBB domain-containing protein [Daejeonella lutea]|uniref:Protein involved in polysaccharide export, contains SLBB domain of the beta-grasp fold n=1 Tax=Daejeonella lutea TaxID=572036 RepID=A0A1T5FAE6_9SPHI|nr:SLBB domain-containing protein [Daejeonella lutea]SKB93145.1 protein involved in polysaccharide export, contains SLBB domain of the beta-grasp fold [Daejeonella lutea]
MRIKFILYILLAGLIFSFQPASAQSFSLDQIQNVKVSQLSDAQIIEAWKKIQELGLSEQDAYKLMEQKGMDPIEVNLFKQRVSLLGLNKSGAKVTSGPQKPDIDFRRDTVIIAQKPVAVPPAKVTADAPLSIYGTDFFNQANLKFNPDFNVATPKGYVIGPGDELIILLTGLNESTQRTRVSPEGNVQVQYAGITYVNGFTIEQATTLLRNKMARIYPALNGGQTQLAVNLGNTRTIKITLVGEVKTPGSYTISSLSTLFNALYLSGGPNINGTLRNIEIIRNNKVYRTVDFYAFLQNGLLDGNIRLQDQDVINFPVYQKRVAIDGEVKRPAIYELRAEEQLDDLIRYAGGYTDIAYRSIAKIDQINELEREVKDIPSNLFSNFVPRNGDKVTIGSIQNRYANRVVLEGAVNRPGPYELSAGLSLAALLKKAEGLKPEAYMERGYIKRTLPNLDKELIPFVPSDIINGRTDIPLLREDSIVVQNRAEFMTDQYVTIGGNVRNPGPVIYRKGMKLADLIAIAGGLNEQAAGHRVEIARIIKNNTDSVANQLVETFNVDLTSSNQDLELQPLDYVTVPRLVNFRPLGNISIRGEVLFPGEYAVQKRDETAQDFIQRAGGLSPYGSLESAQIYRNGVRVNLDLTKLNVNDKSNILLPGDSIFVPRIISFVQVSGAVNNPQYISYLGSRFKYYINAAGGALEDARLKGAFIQYPDGLNKPVRNFLFFRIYPSVKPGSTISVPKKNPDLKLKLGFAEISGIISAITGLVGLIAIVYTNTKP